MVDLIKNITDAMEFGTIRKSVMALKSYFDEIGASQYDKLSISA